MRGSPDRRLRLLTLILTRDCNLDCRYCFQTRRGVYMDGGLAIRAVDYCLEQSGQKVQIDFYGGEPLLAFPLMRRVMEHSWEKARRMGKRICYGFTTNGTLLGRDLFEFLSRFRGRLNVSLDGPPEVHSGGRGPLSWPDLGSIGEFARENSRWEVRINTVVTPQNVKHLSRSLRFLYDLNLGRIHLSYQYEADWQEAHYQVLCREFDRLAGWVIEVYGRRRKMALDALKRTIPGRRPFACNAGRDMFAVTPDGSVYGCFSLAPLAQKAAELNGRLRLGAVDELRGPWQESLGKRASPFRGSDYRTAARTCNACDSLLMCTVCPGTGLLAYGDPSIVPESVCRISRIRRQAAAKVFHALIDTDEKAIWYLID